MCSVCRAYLFVRKVAHVYSIASVHYHYTHIQLVLACVHYHYTHIQLVLACVHYHYTHIQLVLACVHYHYTHRQLQQASNVGYRRLCSSSSAMLDVPRTEHVTIGGRAFSSTAAQIWNSLPRAVQSSESLDNRHFSTPPEN